MRPSTKQNNENEQEQKLEVVVEKLDSMTDFNVLNKLDNSYEDYKPDPTTINDVSPLEGSFVAEAQVSASYINDISELDQIINSMLKKNYGIWTCTKCGKTDKGNMAGKVRRHIEIHIEGMEHPCVFCGKIFR